MTIVRLDSPALVHHLMRINSTSRRIFTLRAMGVVFLACAVFGWGLQYKISLYNPANEFLTSIPHAKLLSQKERPTAQENRISSSSVSPRSQMSEFFPLLLLVTLAMGLRLTTSICMRTADIHDDSLQPQRAHLNFFWFRPPPAALLTY